MKRLFSALILILLASSCSREDFNSLVAKKEYEKAFMLAKESYSSTRDVSHLKNALFAANEYLEESKSTLPMLENYYAENGNFSGIEDLAALSYYNAALSLYKSDKYDSSKMLSEKALLAKPGYARALLLKGKSMVRSGDLKGGYSEIERAVFADSALTDGYAFMANIRLLDGKNDEAEELYRRAVKINPGYYEGWMNLGEFLGATKRVEESEDCYRRALFADPKRIDAYDRLINIFTAKDRMDSVLKYMDMYQKETGMNLRFK